MRILHVIGDSAFGGGSLVIAAIARGARDAGHEVAVLTTDDRFRRHLAHLGVDVVDRDLIHRAGSPVRDARDVVALARLLRARRIELVHTHTTRGGVLGRAAARLAGTPRVVHTAHGFAVAEHDPAWRRAACFAVERVAARWCDEVVTVSEHHGRWADDVGIRPRAGLRVIPNGARDLGTSTDVVRRRTSHDPATLVHVGRLAHGKGLEVLLAAVQRLRERGQLPVGSQLRIVGDGPAADQERDRAVRLGLGDVVTWTGYCPDPAPHLQAADVVVLPSRREGLSLALLEAMSTGRPIVASDLGGNVEALDGGRCGDLVPVGDVDALAGALQRIVVDPARAERLGAAARTRFVARYGTARMVADYVALYAGERAVETSDVDAPTART